jgi:hypothetical protein
MFPPCAPFFACSRPGVSLLRGGKLRSATTAGVKVDARLLYDDVKVSDTCSRLARAFCTTM